MNNTSHRPSIVGRALTALLLSIGFYGLAIGIAFGLLYLVYAQVAFFNRINVRLTIFALIGAGVIIWSILPRIDKFIPPGPRLTRKKFPLLFKEIEKIAKKTDQTMPADVYLVPDINAFVAERGGFMGIGRRRVMGIGLPLLNLMTVDELNAVLAHEFGHYYGGDTALGPWIYKTREAIIRTTVNIAQAKNWLYVLFESYAKMFLKITNAVSRQQEFSADKLAANIVGAGATISGLQKVHKYGYAFNVFFQQEYAPVIDAGYKPPMLDGFQKFLKAPKITEAIQNSYEQQLTEGVSNPYDSHPSLKERIAALESISQGRTINDNPASSLIPPNIDMETPILKTILKQNNKVNSLKNIDWKDVMETIFAPNWGKNTERFQSFLKDHTLYDLFNATQNVTTLFDKVAKAGNVLAPNVQSSQVPKETQLQILNNVIGTAISHTLRQHGWSIRSELGESLTFTKGSQAIQPFDIIQKLLANELTREQWDKLCEDNEISTLRLA